MRLPPMPELPRLPARPRAGRHRRRRARLRRARPRSCSPACGRCGPRWTPSAGSRRSRWSGCTWTPRAAPRSPPTRAMLGVVPRRRGRRLPRRRSARTRTTSLLMAELRQLGGALGRPHEGGGVLSHLDARVRDVRRRRSPPPPRWAPQGHADAVRLSEALAPYANGRQYLNFAENPVDARTAYPDGVWTQLTGHPQRGRPPRHLRRQPPGPPPLRERHPHPVTTPPPKCHFLRAEVRVLACRSVSSGQSRCHSCVHQRKK